MKHLLAATTFAALIAAAPASAQVAYGMSPGGNGASTFTSGSGDWKNAVVIYAEGPDPILLDKLTAPISGDAIGATGGDAGGVTFDVRGGSAGLTGFGGVADATTSVPEPAIWAMMLIGFGAVGGALRSRRKATLRYA